MEVPAGSHRTPCAPSGLRLIRKTRIRLMDMLITQAFLDRYPEEYGALPPRIAAWLGEEPPPDL